MANDADKDRDDVNTKIFHSIAEVFQKAQSAYAGHRKHVAVLKKIQSKAVSQGYESAFNYWFNTLVTKILPLKKSEIIGDRIVKLIAAFVASLDRELEIVKNGEASGVADQHEEVFTRFVDQFVRHILRGVESKDKNVRYRVVQLLAVIMDNIGELDESLYNLLTWSLGKRVFDKEPNVRIQAVFCLTKFQDDGTEEGEADTEGATQTLIRIVQNDTSAETRRAAMLNLVNNPATQPYILERARDVNQVNRRLIYSRILRSMGKNCFEQVDSRIIDQLIQWGLDDREESVRKACTKLISHDWLNMMDGDLIAFLERWNVADSKVAEKAMGCLFEARPDIITKIKFPEDIWRDFTVEIAFLLRCFYLYCVDKSLLEVIETKFPEAAKFADILEHYIQQRFSQTTGQLSEVDKHNLDFIIEQLLTTANRYDFADEVGRRSMLTVIRNMLSIFELNENLIKIGLRVLKTLSINENDFVTMAIEIINDLRDDDIERQEQEERGRTEKSAGTSNDGEGEDNDAAALEAFHRDVEDTVSGKTVLSEGDVMKNLALERELRPDTVVACLTRSSHMLELVNMPLEKNILITSLIDTLITPAVRNTESKVRELGVMNLGLCCLLDLQLATNNMFILGMCVSKGSASLKKVALKIIVDIFSVHGSDVVDGEGKVDSISLHKIFYKVLKNDDLPDCQVIAAEGLCKLFLADVFTDDDLFETLVLSYFSPANTRNEALIQAFAFCIPVYCFSHSSHQKRMARIAADVLLRLCMLWDDLQSSEDPKVDRQSMLKPNVIFQQLLHWTDPRKVVNQSEEDAKNDSVQLDFVLDVTKMFSQIDKKEIKRMLVTNINAAYITAYQDFDKLKLIAEHVEDVMENETLDSSSANSLEKFRKSLTQVLDDAYDSHQRESTGENSEPEDEHGQDTSVGTVTNQIEDDIEDEPSSDPSATGANVSGSSSSSEVSRKRDRSEVEDSSNEAEQIADVNRTSSNHQKNVSFSLPVESEGSDDQMSIDSHDASFTGEETHST